jgi:hypothetical protein
VESTHSLSALDDQTPLAKKWMIESSKKLLFVDKKEKKNTLRTTKERKKEILCNTECAKIGKKEEAGIFFCFTKVQIFSCY